MDTNPTERELGFFNEKFVRGSPDECWLWTASTRKNNRGQFTYRGETVYAYRFAYILKSPNFDQSLHVLHKCDNPLCVNPNHLFLGTNQQNIDDKISKGRQPNGISMGGILSEEEVKKILSFKKTGKYSNKDLSRIFKVSKQHIGRIVRGNSWGWLHNSLVGTEIAS